MAREQLKEPSVLWFRTTMRHHAFEILADGTMDDESCCGAIELNWCADEPARDMAEFRHYEACGTCLGVAELKLPRAE